MNKGFPGGLGCKSIWSEVEAVKDEWDRLHGQARQREVALICEEFGWVLRQKHLQLSHNRKRKQDADVPQDAVDLVTRMIIAQMAEDEDVADEDSDDDLPATLRTV